LQYADNDFRAIVFTTSSVIQTIFVFYIIVNYIIVLFYFRKQLRGGTRKDDRSKEKRKQIITWLYSVYAFVINTKVFYLIVRENSKTNVDANTSILLYLQYSSRRVLIYSTLSPHSLLSTISEETQKLSQ
ncbi:hypothetical protein PENTCL1PPCAC_28519, partial [Pristionchus entomophagus]